MTRRRLLLVHAHPDDETLGTGGTIARYAAALDTSVTLVTCTLGEQGEIMRPELAQLAAGAADQLGGYRIGELAAACSALGLSDHRYLGGVGRWRDTGMVLTGDGIRAAAPDGERLHPRAFASPEHRGTQVDQLAAILADVAPQVVVGYDPGGGYGHPDHVRAHEITMAAAARTPTVRKVYWIASSAGALADGVEALAAGPRPPWRLPTHGELPTVPDETITTRIDVTGQLPAKLSALRAHTTQLAVCTAAGRHGAYALTNEVAQPVLAVECYTLASGDRRVPAASEDDLFDGIEPE